MIKNDIISFGIIRYIDPLKVILINNIIFVVKRSIIKIQIILTYLNYLYRNMEIISIFFLVFKFYVLY